MRLEHEAGLATPAVEYRKLNIAISLVDHIISPLNERFSGKSFYLLR